MEPNAIVKKGNVYVAVSIPKYDDEEQEEQILNQIEADSKVILFYSDIYNSDNKIAEANLFGGRVKVMNEGSTSIVLSVDDIKIISYYTIN